MGLYTVSSSAVIQSQDINQCVYALQPTSGMSEVGNYFISGSAYTTATTFISDCVYFRVRHVTPVSISIDTSLAGPGNMSSPVIARLSQGYVQIYGVSIAGSTHPNMYVGGQYTIYF